MGVAMAREFLKRDPRCQIWFVGTGRELESEILAREGFRHERIDVVGLKGVGFKKFFVSVARLPKSLFQSFALLREMKPNLVIGLGGYASGPFVLAAALRTVPTLIVEPNAVPGVANRMLAFFVDQIAVAFAETKRYFRGKGVETGIPIRASFLAIPRKERGPDFSLLIYGGSQGSHAINQAVCDALPLLKDYADRLRVVHQTGEADQASVAGAYRAAGIAGDVRSFITDMAAEFQKADLIISRSGASTIAELTAAGKASVLIPFPAAADNHQQKNAEILAHARAAIVIEQRRLSGALLAKQITQLMDHPDKITEMENASQRLGKKNATDRILELARAMVH